MRIGFFIMSIGGVSNGNSNQNWQTTGTASTSGTSESDFASALDDRLDKDQSVDGITVNLPNGFSVSVFHFNPGSGLGNLPSPSGSAQGQGNTSDGSTEDMIKAIEQLVAAFKDLPGQSTDRAAAA